MQSDTRLIAYRTVTACSCAEHEVSRSRFIGRCYPVSNEAAALHILETVRKDAWDARHHCFAYRIGSTAQIARYSDDGEPSGTAGLPMMQVLQHRELTETLCVVTRYFGGILLGTGGLVRAYTKACCDAIDAAGITVVTPCVWYRLSIPYALWNMLQSFITEQTSIDRVEYTDAVTCVFHTPTAEADRFLAQLVRKSDARANPIRMEEGYASFPCVR